MNIKKPNSFARHGNDYVAPLTTIDQIVKPSGERYTDKEFEFMSNVENVMFGENCAGKNLLRPTLQTQTKNGVTCTNNGDGTYTVNGTATDSITFGLLGKSDFKNGTYKIVGCPSGKGDYFLRLIDFNVKGVNDVGSGAIIDITSGYIQLNLGIASGTVCNNLVFKPMITTDLTATYDDFEPYVKSLKQLTDSALNMDLLWTNASPTSSFAPQTISLDLSKYQFVYIIYLHSVLSNYNYGFSELLDKRNYKKMSYSSPDDAIVVCREVNVHNNGITYGNCYHLTTYGSAERTLDNELYIPYQIYGVR